jgi:hypothetical protein
LAEAGTVPPGNGAESALWEGVVFWGQGDDDGGIDLLFLLFLLLQDWLQEAGTVPPGNGAESALWEGEEVSEADLIARMSPTERAAYEEKKLKMRKAMVGVALVLHVQVLCTCSMGEYVTWAFSPNNNGIAHQG